MSTPINIIVRVTFMEFQVAELPVPQERPAYLIQVESLRGGALGETASTEEGSGIRFKAIRQEGLRVGAQGGLANRYGTIMEYMAKIESKLNVVFSFNGFIEGGRMLIPSVVQVPDQFVMDESKGSATVIRNAYTVEEEAKIVSVAPTWRDYLWQEYAYPELPHKSLLPRSEAEVEVWEDAVEKGWAAGVNQGGQIFSDRLAQLTMAVEGRHLYKTLQSKKMISPAALSVVNNSVTFNGRTMNVGETIYAIGQQTNYTAAKDWKPVWTKQQ